MQLDNQRTSKLTRRSLCLGLAASLALTVSPALAGSYLNRAALLLKHASEDAAFLRRHLNDRELAKMVHRIASGRLEAASKMTVPVEVAQAHPHLLLVLESYERAFDAAENRQMERFLVYEQRAHEEEGTFRAVLKQLGWKLPEFKSRRR